MNAVWLVRGHQVVSRMRFWTAIVGYDPRDHSIGQRIYLVYATVFFSLWGFAVLVLLADLGVMVLTWFGEIPPVQSAILISSGILIGIFLLRSYRYAKRSPFTFLEEDATLICQTPVDRRQVAIAWLLGDWLFDGLPFWSGAVILSYACQQLAAPTGVSWSDLPDYLTMGLRAVSIVIPLHLALTSSAYAFGAIRLRGEKELTSLQLRIG